MQLLQLCDEPVQDQTQARPTMLPPCLADTPEESGLSPLEDAQGFARHKTLQCLCIACQHANEQPLNKLVIKPGVGPRFPLAIG